MEIEDMRNNWDFRTQGDNNRIEVLFGQYLRMYKFL